MAKNNFL